MLLRSMMRDDRLEAVAGAPVIDLVTLPSLVQGTPLGGTVLFAGSWDPRLNGTSLGQMTIHDYAGGDYAYVNALEPKWSTANIPASQRFAEGGLFMTWITKTAAGPTSFGRHAIDSKTYTWMGPMLATGYDHALTPTEAMRVLRWLARHLDAPISGGGARKLLRRLVRRARVGWAR